MNKYPGITQMTAKKHSFEGFSVRKQSKGLMFQQYVSAATGSIDAGTLSQRRMRAFTKAKSALQWLNLILGTPRYYHRGALTKVTLSIIENEGFKIKRYTPKTKSI